MYGQDALNTVEFCAHGEVGKACHHGICYKNTQCVCDPGWVHDSAWMYYPVCSVPDYLKPLLEVLVFIPLCFVFVYGIIVHRRLKRHQQPQQNETRQRLVTVTLAFLGSYIALCLTHHFERGLGILSQVCTSLVLLAASLGIVPELVDLYIFPIYKFVQAPTAGVKRVLYVSFAVCFSAHVAFLVAADWHIGFRIFVVEGPEAFMSLHYAGFNDFVAYALLAMGVVYLIGYVALYLSNRKLHRMLSAMGTPPTAANGTQIARDEANAPQILLPSTSTRRRRAASRQSNNPATGEELTSQAKLHLQRLAKVRPGLILSSALGNIVVFACHFGSGRMFAYQHVLFMNATLPVPWITLGLLMLAADNTESTQALPTDQTASAAGGAGSSRVSTPLSSTVRETRADSGASGFSMTHT